MARYSLYEHGLHLVAREFGMMLSAPYYVHQQNEWTFEPNKMNPDCTWIKHGFNFVGSAAECLDQKLALFEEQRQDALVEGDDDEG